MSSSRILSLLLTLLFALPGCGAGEIDGGGVEPEVVGEPGTPAPAPANNPDPKSSFETCDDGLDNNGDGEVDEGCACKPGAEQACYPGPAATRGVGACKDGAQRCAAAPEGSGGTEFSSWESCEGAVLPSTEICGDGIDNDCNGLVDDAPGCACKPGETRACYSGPAGSKGVGQCAAGKETCKPDGSGFGACQGEVLPANELCGDGLDNDCDGSVDEGCIAPQQPKPCTVATLKHVTGAADCGPNQAVYMMDDGAGPNFICCPLPATDILSGTPTVRAGQCAANEVIVGAVAQYTFKCQAINTKRYKLGAPQLSCYFGSGAAGGGGVASCQAHPASFSVLQQNLFGSDGCSGFPYGSLFVRQTSKYCKDMQAARLFYTGAVAGDPAGAPLTMFQP